MFYKQYLMEKHAARKVGDSDFNADKERELIRQYQMTKDPQLLKKLVRMFDGAIQHAINISPTYGIENPSAIKGKALSIFAKAIETYNPDQGAKPSSYITSTIRWGLTKENNRHQHTTRMGEAETINNTDIYNASQRLALEGVTDPTPQQIQQEVHKMKGKFISIDDIQKIQSLQRTSLYGGRVMGGDEGENIRTEDIHNTGRINMEEMYSASLNRDMLMNKLDQLTPLEKNIIMDRHSIGGRPKEETKWSAVALNNNINNTYKVKKIYNDAFEKLQRMMRDGDDE